jgi:aspartate/methionine/tyrosine aminotransferase
MQHIRLAKRLDELGTETAFEVLAKAKDLESQGHSVVHLEIGEPDMDTPSHITRAAIKALTDGHTHYGPAAGLPELREIIAKDVAFTRKIDVVPEQVIVTPGAKPIIFFTLLSLVEPGDEVIYPNPGFPIYESMIRFCGAKPIPIPFTENNGYKLDLDRLASKINNRTKVVIINSPHNPTGSVMSRKDVETLSTILSNNEHIHVLSDEIYKHIIYNKNHHSIASMRDLASRTIILDGFSKTYAMTGWRLGYGVFPKYLVPHITKLITNSVSCTASFIQIAAIQALTGTQQPITDMVNEFKMRRDLIVKGLQKIKGINCPRPDGAFYVFPDISQTGIGSQEFQDRALAEAKVALLSGTSFGENGEGYVRLSYANSQKNILSAIERLDDFVNKNMK